MTMARRVPVVRPRELRGVVVPMRTDRRRWPWRRVLDTAVLAALVLVAIVCAGLLVFACGGGR